MSIRYAIPSDLPFIIDGLEDNRNIEQREENQITATSSDKKELINAIDKKLIRIVEENKKQIAFIYFRTDFHILYVQKKYLWVDLVYVKKEYRGKGIGTLLYQDVVKIAKEHNLNTFVIDIFSANKNSLKFHKKLGFEPLYTIYTKEISQD